MPPIIELKNISKCYKLGSISGGSLREDITQWFNINENNTSDSANEFWALRDISFSVDQGEVIGIIGHNGAGKSTLLKILSRITDPTKGEAILRGRVASLLEVGTGFHPELTGRENIYLNGATLGMKKQEIDSKLDEIIDFSGCEKFIDTPVKRYSSGMTVRLGFAVAAHLEPEILIIDEVLAVGDIAFQEKCLGKMKDVAGQGKTVLFVSHQMTAIENLCSKCILLEKGSIKKIGSTTETINKYYDIIFPKRSSSLIDRTDRQGSGEVLLEKIELTDHIGNDLRYVQCGGEACFIFKYRNIKLTEELHDQEVSFSANINNSSHQRLAMMSSDALSHSVSLEKLISEGLVIRVNKMPLMPGSYSLTVFLGREDYIIDWVVSAFEFTIIENDYYGSGRLQKKGHGDLLIDYSLSKDINGLKS